ncbi:MAG TPA: MarC family protein [Caulobacter sp.]|nr:MarC family protein [Caulobacter sp.]
MVVIALMVWVFYCASDKVLTLLGVNGARAMSRPMAFLLMCIDAQIVHSGVEALVFRFSTLNLLRIRTGHGRRARLRPARDRNQPPHPRPRRPGV